MKALLTIKEIAGALGLHANSLNRRAKRNNWPYTERQDGPGSPTKYYSFEGLPTKLQADIIQGAVEEVFGRLLVALDTERLPDTVKAEIQARLQRRREVETAASRELVPVFQATDLDKTEERIALARADLLRHYTKAAGRAKPGQRVPVKKQFISTYNEGELLQGIHVIVGSVSFQTVERWLLVYKKGNKNHTVIARRYPKTRKRKVTEIEGKILTDMALSRKLQIAEVIRHAKIQMRERGILPSVNDMTYRRYLERYKENNYDIWTFAREGYKAYNDKCAYYISRDTDKLDVGDVIVADGHKFNFLIVNPASGKPQRMTWVLWFDMKSCIPLGWEIMPTENTDAINTALRRSILLLGKIPKVAYMDNGKAFRGRYFQGTGDFRQAGYGGIFNTLGISWIYAWAYHPQSKTIERFFKTFAELERLAPSYIGTDIAAKPAHLQRNEELHKKLHKQLTQDRYPTLEDANLAIATWVEEYAKRTQPGGRLGKRTPFEVFKAGRGPGVDADKLRILMMRSTPKIVRRCEVELGGIVYQSEQLHGYNGKAILKYDSRMRESVLVYDQNEQFICEAYKKTLVHTAAKVLGTKEDVETLKEQIRIKNRLKADTARRVEEIVTTGSIPALQDVQKRIGFGPGVLILEQEKTKKLTKQAYAEQGVKYTSSSVDPKGLPEPMAALTGETEIGFEYDWERYEHLLAQRETRGLNDEENGFISDFESSEEWRMCYNPKAAGGEV